jgi:ergothioneine biosynthesis protein EgtB
MSSVPAGAGDAGDARQTALTADYLRVRAVTVAMTDGLSEEDCLIQSMPDASPIKWHLAHITWFFETFVLEASTPDYVPVDPAYRVLFNSYYVGIGERHPRAERGLISRPSFAEVLEYRRTIDDRVTALMRSRRLTDAMLDTVELGLHHEQQHQELLLTDLKHHLWKNPTRPAYRSPPATPAARRPLPPMRFIERPEGFAQIGADGDDFAFDNERPRHRVWLAPFAFATRPVACGEYLEFIEAGGYAQPEWWLSDGWDVATREGWQAPLYWQRDAAGTWHQFTLFGMRPVDPDEPVAHVSYYEADAYARWAGARLATETEWECVAADRGLDDAHVFDGTHPHPRRAESDASMQLFGDVWEWTGSAYLPYPGFQPAPGAVGEYNGKFMINQMVLRGGSCATPVGHVRASYRNFFPPAARWQFSGIRLARDLVGYSTGTDR